MNEANLASFLKLGYFLDYEHRSIRFDLSGVDKSCYNNASEEELVSIGRQILRDAISDSYEPNEEIVVPLSGGLDSRAILAGLLEHTEARNIVTYTFGMPGSRDYDIGCEVACNIGTKHQSFDLTTHQYRQEELEDISRRIDQQAVLFHHWPVWEMDRLFGDAAHWSGFMGDPLAGSHLPAGSGSSEVSAARDAFVLRNTYVKSVDLSGHLPGFAEHIDFPTHATGSFLTIDEYLDFTNRQRKFVAPIVLIQGYLHKTPFLYQPWIDFVLSVDNDRHRRDQKLYKRILQTAFPRLFKMRTKTNMGLPLNAPSWMRIVPRVESRFRRLIGQPQRSVNYLDFDRAIREKADVRAVIVANVNDLEERKLLGDVNCTRILNDHLNQRGHFADALIVLASLEIHLKTGKHI